MDTSNILAVAAAEAQIESRNGEKEAPASEPMETQQHVPVEPQVPIEPHVPVEAQVPVESQVPVEPPAVPIEPEPQPPQQQFAHIMPNQQYNGSIDKNKERYFQQP